MATPNVIDCPAFSKPDSFNKPCSFNKSYSFKKPYLGSNAYLSSNSLFSSNSYGLPQVNTQRWFVREDEGDYGKLLNMPQWPQFPDSAYLKPMEAGRFYRGIQGMQGLIHLLNRSHHLRGLHKDYDGEIDTALSEAQESKLWSALIELGADLGRLADDVHHTSETLNQ